MCLSSGAELRPVKEFTAVGAASVTDGPPACFTVSNVRRCFTFWARLPWMKATNPSSALG